MTKHSTSPNFLRHGQAFITKPGNNAKMMNEFFQSVLSGECVSILQQNTPRSIHTLPDFQVSTTEVYDLLCNIESSKTCGPDNIPERILKEVAPEISPFIGKLFNKSLYEGLFPQKWKMANLFPLHKKDV
jgi:hypothetical protein